MPACYRGACYRRITATRLQGPTGCTFCLRQLFLRPYRLTERTKDGLSGRKSDTAANGLVVGEVAERIKALKASQTIEAAPQRTKQKHATAAEPVTAQIRRRAEAQIEHPTDTIATTKTQFMQYLPVPLRPPAAGGDNNTSGSRPRAGSQTRQGIVVKPIANTVTFVHRSVTSMSGASPMATACFRASLRCGPVGHSWPLSPAPPRPCAA